MKTEDKSDFSKILRILLKTYGKTADKELTDIYWNALSDVEIDAIRHAANAHIRTNRFAPTPADIRELAGANKSEWQTPEEAWNALPKSESEGGWMCQEIATAMGACFDSLDAGDRIGARMAFLEVYKREIQGKRGKPNWWLSEPNALTHEERQQWKQGMLASKPGYRPELEADIKRQIEYKGSELRSQSGALVVAEGKYHG